MRPAPAAAVLALLLTVTACGGSSESDPEAPATAAPAPSAAADAPAPAAPPAPPVADGAIVLRGDGLSVTSEGATVDLPFGTGTSIAVPTVAAVLGELEQMTVACGQGPRTAAGVGGFDLLFDGDRLVGWDESGVGLATADGIRLGSTKADLVRALPDATFSRDTLGDEFTSPSGLGGFLDGAADTATIVGLTGGEACVAR